MASLLYIFIYLCVSVYIFNCKLAACHLRTSVVVVCGSSPCFNMGDPESTMLSVMGHMPDVRSTMIGIRVMVLSGKG